jgi:ribonuclease J
MEINILGGLNEIGGNKILLDHKGTRLFLDFGMSFGQSGKYFSEFIQRGNAHAFLTFLNLASCQS